MITQPMLFETRPVLEPTEKLDLRILVWSNPLMVDKVAKTFHYWKDSGFIFTKNLIKSLPSNYRFYWVIPDKLKGKDISWFLEANKNIEPIYYPYSTSIHQNRYEFYGDVVKKAFPYMMDIDVIINNQPEVSANLRVWAQNQRRDNPVILSFYHWIDCEEFRKFAEELGGYSTRQYDGAMASDKLYFHSESAIHMFMNQMDKEFKILPDIDNLGIFTPPPTKFGNTPLTIDPDKKIILFNHRLNGTTNWKMLIDVMDDIYRIRQDFVLWITDDSKIQNKRFFSDRPYIRVEQIPAESYGWLMEHSHFGVCNHKGYSTWNMALLDSYYNGCYMLAPREDGNKCYVDMLGDQFILWHNPNDREELQYNILACLDASHELLQEYAQHVVDTAPAFSNQDFIDIANDIESLVRARISGAKKVPEKYERVESLINTNCGVTKSDWVNEFWSFHVNSNFQKIRWTLLQEGFRDDTTKSEPTYYGKEHD